MKTPFLVPISALLVLLVLALGGLYYYSNAAPEGADPIERPAANAPFITTPDPVIEAMIEIAEVTEADVVYDLGCGDGRILITAAKKTGCRGIGYDIDPALVEQSRKNAQDVGVDHLVSFEVQDVFTVDMSGASAILMYLLPQMQEELIPQFQKMKPGSRVVSHDSGLGDVYKRPPDKQREVVLGESDIHNIYMWNVPIKDARND
jgi:SAM-dependent methyltransferase